MMFSTLIEVSITILMAGFTFGAPSLNDVDLDDIEANIKNADIYYDQRQNGTENYKVNIDGVSVIWTNLGSLITASGLLDLPFGVDGENSQDDVNNFLFKANKDVEKEGLDGKHDQKKPSIEILPVEIIEDESQEGKSSDSSEMSSSDIVVEESHKIGKGDKIRKRKFSITDFLKPFARRTMARSQRGAQ